MKAIYVNPVRTQLSFGEAAECHRWALKELIGTKLNDNVLSLAMAKTSLETGNYKYMWNWNFGNVKASDSYVGIYTCITLNEVLNGKLVWFAPEGQLSASPAKGGKLIQAPINVPEGHPQTRMRAFANQYDGIDQYMSFLANGRYKTAFNEMLTGNATNYVHQLKVHGYFTASETLYKTGVVNLLMQIYQKLKNLYSKEPSIDLEWEELKKLVPEIQIPLEY